MKEQKIHNMALTVAESENTKYDQSLKYTATSERNT